MSYKGKMIFRCVLGAALSVAGVALSANGSYYLVKAKGARMGSNVAMGAIYKAYGKEMGDEICRNALVYVKDVMNVK